MAFDVQQTLEITRVLGNSFSARVVSEIDIYLISCPCYYAYNI
jgi:hypothetical protein